MEFDELQKIWDSQTKEPLWVINEAALHKRIVLKKDQMSHIADFSELLSIVVNLGAGSFVFGINYFKRSDSLFMYLMATWMLIAGLCVLVSRIRRLKGKDTFDRSVLGELNYAISMASYQVHLSRLMRWNIVPIVILSLLSVWEGGKSIWLAVGLLAVFALSYFAAGWEHRIYVGKERELEVLRTKLLNQ
ncbi:hypothetical protein [Runella sp.]|uniref:hypothetical protein n=1 Tax=Runella sp. TaxID=1960881 RepID=UPI003D0E3385